MDSLDVDENPPLIMKLVDAQHHAQLLAITSMPNQLDFTPTNVMKLHAILQKPHKIFVVDLKCQYRQLIDSFFKST